MRFESFQLFQCEHCRRLDRYSRNECRCGHGVRDVIDTRKLLTLAHNLAIGGFGAWARNDGALAAADMLGKFMAEAAKDPVAARGVIDRARKMVR